MRLNALGLTLRKQHYWVYSKWEKPQVAYVLTGKLLSSNLYVLTAHAEMVLEIGTQSKNTL